MGFFTNTFYQDLIDALRLKFFWLRLSWLEFYGWYGTLSLGLAWVLLSPFLFAAGISIVYSEVFNLSPWEHFLYVYSGYVCWMFIADTLGNGAEVYRTSYSYYSEIKLPLVGFNIKSTLVRGYSFAINTVLYLIVALFYGASINLVLLPIVLVYFFLVSIFTSIILSLLMAFLPDLRLVIQNLMRLLFFITPIVWVPDEKLSGLKAIFVYANPFYYIVDIYRLIIAADQSVRHIEMHFLIFSVLALLAFALYNKFSKRMVFVCQ